MGYESKLYFVQTYPNSDVRLPGETHLFAEKIIEINMSKIGGMPSCFKKPADHFVYADDGNTQILEDKYGDCLYECELPDLYLWLINEMDNDPDGYRRFSLLLSVLEGFGDVEYSDSSFWLELKPKWKYVKVLHYGY